MEQAVEGLDDPAEAAVRLRERLNGGMPPAVSFLPAPVGADALGGPQVIIPRR